MASVMKIMPRESITILYEDCEAINTTQTKQQLVSFMYQYASDTTEFWNQVAMKWDCKLAKQRDKNIKKELIHFPDQEFPNMGHF